jgi:hypothetical protein
MAPQNAARPATAQTVDEPQVSTFGGVDNPPNSKASPAAQAEKRNPAAVREATIASILDQANFVLGGVRLNAEIAQQFAGAGDQRGFLYALDQTVRHAIRDGAEGESSFGMWLKERRNRRALPYRLEQCVRNDAAKDGLWKINDARHARQAVYAKTTLSISERFAAARKLTEWRGGSK